MDIRAGMAVIKLRFLRALRGAGVWLHEIHPARLIHPIDGIASGYYHRHPDPVVPVYWRAEEIGPSIEHAIAMYDSRYTAPSSERSLPIAGSPTKPESTTDDPEAPEDSKPALPLPPTRVVDAP